MRLRFKSMLTLIMMLIIICIAIGIGYLFYKEVIVNSDIVVDGALTINYTSGKSFQLKGDSEIEFAVTNNSDEQAYYYVQFTDVYAKDIKYNLISSSKIEMSNTLQSGIIFNQVAIGPEETIKYVLKFKTTNEEIYKGTINVGIKSNEENTFIDVILNSNNISNAYLSALGEPATLNEGLFASLDDLGVAYYFRGNVTNNYVSFADLTWRIVKVNGDGSVKLVLDKTIDEVAKYYDKEKDFANSSIISTLDDWYTLRLEKYSDYIAYYKFCNDLTLDQDGKTYAAYNRIAVNNIPNLICLGTLTNAKIGLLTIDEVILAGGSKSANKDYYLYNENITNPYFTMSSATTLNDVYYPFVINPDGSYATNIAGTLLRGVRPVINIIRNARVTGDGTIDNPYELIMN